MAPVPETKNRNPLRSISISSRLNNVGEAEEKSWEDFGKAIEENNKVLKTMRICKKVQPKQRRNHSNGRERNHRTIERELPRIVALKQHTL